MNPGVVSLRCPACARPFLSLPPQRESVVTCPHCQRAGTAGSFAAAGASPGEALVQSLRQRVLQPGTLHPRPTSTTSAAWPAAPPIFVRPPKQPPLSAEEPQWPFIAPETDEPASPFTDLDLETHEREMASLLPERSERNVPLGIFLLVLVISAIWVAWQTLQPPMVVEIPALPGPPAETRAAVAWPEETAAAAELAPDLEKFPAILAR